MEATERIEQAPLSASWPHDETHENAMRILREGEEKARRLREVAREHRQTVPHELHVSIGD